MEKWEWEEQANWPPDLGDGDFQTWLAQMDVDGTPWFEGCECEEYREAFAGDEYEDDMIELSYRDGRLSGEEITRFKCPFCGRKYHVYTSGPYRGHEAHEAD